MRLLIIFTTILTVFPFKGGAIARPLLEKNKFENPAQKFEGTWRVERHDYREFAVAPADAATQFQNEAAAFPIGQRLRFEHTGSAALPGGIDPVTMRHTGPIGDTLRMTLLAPFAKELCSSKSWSQVCGGENHKEYSDELMIDEIVNWTKETPTEYASVWSDLLPLQYSMLHMAKTYHFKARLARNGDQYLMVTINGRAKGRGIASDSDAKADVGILLKPINR